ncbi:Transposase component [Pseudomonas syringae pv. pisi]|nr:Transposase component [Pseudomonas syringae pv. pisi]RMM23570.1 hypothetical protein ALQ82_200192 [Pseudomonas syringae pv. pisi]RMO32332.1 Transposase component [Pseudomonas syringae pv. pisi]
MHIDPSRTGRYALPMRLRTQRIGEDVSEKLEYTPGLFTVERYVRGKWICDDYETLIQASLSPLLQRISTAEQVKSVLNMLIRAVELMELSFITTLS